MSHGLVNLNNGKNTRFWEDKLPGNFTLKQQCPTLYNIVRRKQVTAATVFSTTPLNVSFQHGLVVNNLVVWPHLVARIAHMRLNDRSDTLRWNLQQNGLFTVCSMYCAMICNGHVRQNKILWKLKLPLKTKIFMWYLKKGGLN